MQSRRRNSRAALIKTNKRTGTISNESMTKPKNSRVNVFFIFFTFFRGETFWTEDAEGDDQLHLGPERQ